MSFIETIEIKNFKSIRHQKIEGCKKINVFIGYPNVGKSNILEALSLFSINSKDFEFSKFVRVENTTGLFFNGNISEKSTIKLNNSNRIRIQFESNNVSLTHEFDAQGYGFDAIDKTRMSVNSSDAWVLSNFTIRQGDLSIIQFREGSGIDNNAIKKGSVSHIYKYHFDRNTKFKEGYSHHLSDPLGENIFDILSSNELIRKEVVDLFKDYKLKFSFDKSTREFKILKDVGDDIFLISYSMIADTLHRLIFYKAAIKSNQKSILLFEEPEAHMFPPYIKKLTTDIVLDITNQFFLATHSPYVLDELILEAGDNLSVYVVDYKDGETIIHHLSQDDLSEVREYGVDLFFNIESYLKHGQINNS